MTHRMLDAAAQAPEVDDDRDPRAPAVHAAAGRGAAAAAGGRPAQRPRDEEAGDERRASPSEGRQRHQVSAARRRRPPGDQHAAQRDQRRARPRSRDRSCARSRGAVVPASVSGATAPRRRGRPSRPEVCPTSSTVCGPGSTSAGTVKVRVTAPISSAVAEPRSDRCRVQRGVDRLTRGEPAWP